MRLSRRGLLLSLPPLAALAACRRQIEEDPGRDRLVALVTDREVWVPIGEAYLAEYPREDDISRLTAELRDAVEWPGASESDAALARRVASRVRSDFAAGRVTSVSGWVLSETEARLAALVALTRGS